MGKKIPQLSMPTTFPQLDAKKSSILKTAQKFNLTGLETAWVELTSWIFG